MLEKLHIIITLLAALVVTAFGLYERTSPQVLGFRLILVIVLFYLIGLVVRAFVRNSLTNKNKSPEPIVAKEEVLKPDEPEEDDLKNTMSDSEYEQYLMNKELIEQGLMEDIYADETEAK